VPREIIDQCLYPLGALLNRFEAAALIIGQLIAVQE